MQALHILFILILFNLTKAEFGTIIKFEPASLSIILGTNTTFKLILTNITDKATSKNVSVTLQSEEEIVLNPYELNFNFGSNTSNAKQVHLIAYRCGYTEINTTNASQIDNKEAFLSVTVYKFEEIKWTIEIVGWIYFLAWSLSFYPQTYTNFKRKSVVGFNFDYVALNFVGHTSYCIFNVGLKYFEFFQNQYFKNHKHGVNPVQLNDVLFSSHAVFATIVHIVQCFIYEKGGQKISKICMALLGIIFVVIVMGLTLAIFDVHDYLSFLYFFSYIKLAITFLKYCPQAYQNWKSKSTSGWSIGYVYLDIIGGFNSIIQMMLIAFNFDDWPSLYGDLGKLGLGAISILFDFLFFFQHYILYKDNNDRAKTKSNVSQVGLVLDGYLTHI